MAASNAQPGLLACIEVCDLLHRDSSTVSLLASRVCDLLSGVRKTLRDSPEDSEQVRPSFSFSFVVECVIHGDATGGGEGLVVSFPRPRTRTPRASYLRISAAGAQRVRGDRDGASDHGADLWRERAPRVGYAFCI